MANRDTESTACLTLLPTLRLSSLTTSKSPVFSVSEAFLTGPLVVAFTLTHLLCKPTTEHLWRLSSKTTKTSFRATISMATLSLWLGESSSSIIHMLGKLLVRHFHLKHVCTVCMRSMDGGQWTPASKNQYNLRDAVSRCTTQVRMIGINSVLTIEYLLIKIFDDVVVGACRYIPSHGPLYIFRLTMWECGT